MEAASRNAITARGFELEARRIARLMRDKFNVGFVDVGGWDTHVGQGGAEGYLANRLEELGRGLAAFADEMGAAWSDTVVVVLSEFGRTFRENGNRGTDHGHGSVYWVAGGGVRGGRIAGEQVRGAAGDAASRTATIPCSTNTARCWRACSRACMASTPPSSSACSRARNPKTSDSLSARTSVSTRCEMRLRDRALHPQLETAFRSAWQRWCASSKETEFLRFRAREHALELRGVRPYMRANSRQDRAVFVEHRDSRGSGTACLPHRAPVRRRCARRARCRPHPVDAAVAVVGAAVAVLAERAAEFADHHHHACRCHASPISSAKAARPRPSSSSRLAR